MKRGDVFKSVYLKAEDLKGGRVPVTIESVDLEMVGQDEDKTEKAVAHFKNKERGLVLNATNWDSLESMFGEDSDAWVGKTVVLYVVKTKYQGRPVLGIRIDPYRGKSAPVPEPDPEPEVSETPDDVPF